MESNAIAVQPEPPATDTDASTAYDPEDAARYRRYIVVMADIIEKAAARGVH